MEQTQLKNGVKRCSVYETRIKYEYGHYTASKFKTGSKPGNTKPNKKTEEHIFKTMCYKDTNVEQLRGQIK